MKGRRKKGYNAERELVKLLRVKGWRAVRIPVSAPSGEPLPDVLATKDDTILAFEVKVNQKGCAYFSRRQIEKLHLFLEMFQPFNNRIAIIAAKFPYRGWVMQKVDEDRNYTLHPGDPSISIDSNENITDCPSKNPNED
ncbi:MAG: endonuclease [Candidatus Hodarchaeota archaeon]